jgi:hypothetical protein
VASGTLRGLFGKNGPMIARSKSCNSERRNVLIMAPPGTLNNVAQ